MKVKNITKATIFFPYAGINNDRGRDLNPGQESGDLESERFHNKLLQADWKRGKITVHIEEQDLKILGAKLKDTVDQVNAEATKSHEAPKELEVVIAPEAPVPEIKTEPVPVIEPEKQAEEVSEDLSKESAEEDTPEDTSNMSLDELNKPKRRKKKYNDASDVTAKAATSYNG